MAGVLALIFPRLGSEGNGPAARLGCVSRLAPLLGVISRHGHYCVTQGMCAMFTPRSPFSCLPSLLAFLAFLLVFTSALPEVQPLECACEDFLVTNSLMFPVSQSLHFNLISERYLCQVWHSRLAIILSHWKYDFTVCYFSFITTKKLAVSLSFFLICFLWLILSSSILPVFSLWCILFLLTLFWICWNFWVCGLVFCSPWKMLFKHDLYPLSILSFCTG